MIDKIVMLLLNNKNIYVYFKVMKGALGETDGENIFLNPRGDILPTLIHECLHILKPEITEDEEMIEIFTRKILKKMRHKDYYVLMFAMFQAMLRGMKRKKGDDL